MNAQSGAEKNQPGPGKGNIFHMMRVLTKTPSDRCRAVEVEAESSGGRKTSPSRHYAERQTPPPAFEE